VKTAKNKAGASLKRPVLDLASALACICIMATAFLAACSSFQTVPAVKGGQPVAYQCRDDARIEVRYFNLADNSLHFVKLTLPDGSTHTLPQMLSASGVRYSDDGLVAWWAKGDDGFVEMRDENGSWQVVHADCKRISPDHK
jgi:membrane-bound inhibitor of C-type lysozyme